MLSWMIRMKTNSPRLLRSLTRRCGLCLRTSGPIFFNWGGWNRDLTVLGWLQRTWQIFRKKCLDFFFWKSKALCLYLDFMSLYIQKLLLLAARRHHSVQWTRSRATLLLIESGEENEEKICTNKNNTFEVVYFVFCSTPLTSKVIIFCHVSAWKCSMLWALTLTTCGVLSQWEVPHHRRAPWTVCTDCPPWSHSCFNLSAGISAHTYHRHSAFSACWPLCPLTFYIQSTHFGHLY